MQRQITPYGFGVSVQASFADAVVRTKEALAREGFGVLTEIDIAATLKKKLNVDFPPYLILGACNPPLAHRALTAEREIGLLLPCNVIVYGGDDEGVTHIAAMDPVAAMDLSGNSGVVDVAAEVRERLERVLKEVAALRSGAPVEGS